MIDMNKRTTLQLAALVATAAAIVGCGKKEAPVAAAPAASAAKAEPLKIAFAYVGPVGDAGWTFAHDAGRKAVHNVHKVQGVDHPHDPQQGEGDHQPDWKWDHPPEGGGDAVHHHAEGDRD